ncbi:MAG: cytochrome c oxidase subunit II, partial [Nitrosomonadales bacterium]
MGSKVKATLVWISTLILYPNMVAGASEELSKINLPTPETAIAASMYDLHMFVMWVCLAIFIGVFGTMLYS